MSMSKQESLIEALSAFQDGVWTGNGYPTRTGDLRIIVSALLYLVENTPALEDMRQDALAGMNLVDGCPQHCDHSIGTVDGDEAVCGCEDCDHGTGIGNLVIQEAHAISQEIIKQHNDRQSGLNSPPGATFDLKHVDAARRAGEGGRPI